MHVLATAGHVDHGKSTLLRALTGIEPDRWAEERRRGMTLDLGFAWTTLPDGQTAAFVDVPGHERYVATMLAGVGSVPAVMVVVAADEGWRAQTTEHVTLLDSLSIGHGILVVTRSDLADPEPAMLRARTRLSRTSLGHVGAVAVSAVTGAGLPELRSALQTLVWTLPAPSIEGRVRLFIDRAFSVRGSGTVVTGTLAAGTLRVGDQLLLEPSGLPVRVRGLQALGQPLGAVEAVARVAVNLRGAGVDTVHRGDALLTPDAWAMTSAADVRLKAIDPVDLPGDVVLHIGSAAVPGRVRAFGEDTARLRLAHPLPLQPGDRAVLREPSSRLATGLVVLDVDPPPLRRRGAARARAIELQSATGTPDPVAEVTRRSSMTRAELAARGLLRRHENPPGSLLVVGERLVDPIAWQHWGDALVEAVDAHRRSAPLQPGLPIEAARQALQLPDVRLVDALVRELPGVLAMVGGRIARPGAGASFTPAQQRALDELGGRLRRNPLAAPDANELAAHGLTKEVLATAAKSGLLLRLPGEVILHPTAADVALTAISELAQPFTLSQARQALRTTRRVAVPLLEHLDAIGWTIRIDATRRRLRDRA